MNEIEPSDTCLIGRGFRRFWEAWEVSENPRLEAFLGGAFDESLGDDGEGEDGGRCCRKDGEGVGGIEFGCHEEADWPAEEVDAEGDVAEFCQTRRERRRESSEEDDDGRAEEWEGEVRDAGRSGRGEQDAAGDETCGADGPALVEAEEECAGAKVGRGFIQQRVREEQGNIRRSFPVGGSEATNRTEERHGAEHKKNGRDAAAFPEDEGDGEEQDVVDDFVGDGPKGAIQEVAHFRVLREGERAAGDIS